MLRSTMIMCRGGSLTDSAISAAKMAAKEAKPRVLVTGGLGQIGTDLVLEMRRRFGTDNVLVSDAREPPAGHPLNGSGKFEKLDCLDREAYESLVAKWKPEWLLHLPAIMSVLGEKIPDKALDLNINSARYALDCARDHQCRLFIPSTIAVFGEDCGKVKTQDDTVLNPITIYGATKIFSEQVGAYYRRKYGVDFRSVRYPGVLSAATLPGGGTTDYAVHMYHYALKGETYHCPLKSTEQLPMMYITDVVDSTIQMLTSDRSCLSRCVYNVTGFSFSPEELRLSIEAALGGQQVNVVYEPGEAQMIAETWPNTMDDHNARMDWHHNPKFNLMRTTEEMLRLIPEMHNIPVAQNAQAASHTKAKSQAGCA